MNCKTQNTNKQSMSNHSVNLINKYYRLCYGALNKLISVFKCQFSHKDNRLTKDEIESFQKPLFDVKQLTIELGYLILTYYHDLDCDLENVFKLYQKYKTFTETLKLKNYSFWDNYGYDSTHANIEYRLRDLRYNRARQQISDWKSNKTHQKTTQCKWTGYYSESDFSSSSSSGSDFSDSDSDSDDSYSDYDWFTPSFDWFTPSKPYSFQTNVSESESEQECKSNDSDSDYVYSSDSSDDGDSDMDYVPEKVLRGKILTY